jgi:very-short-patch-repair endonuclease
MARSIPPAALDFLARQQGVISRAQAVSSGMPGHQIDGRLRSGRWQQLHLGVYAAFTGPAPREAVLWAAVLRAGPGAVLSHQSAAELYDIVGPAGAIHVSIPAEQRLSRVPGLVVHRSSRLNLTRNPALLPPRTRIDDTILDLVESAATFDDAFAWLCRAVAQQLTTATRLRAAMEARPKVRWRASLRVALADLRSGARSVLEFRYIRDVERAHGLPQARRQARLVTASRACYLDNLYEEAAVAVELDGQAAHPVEDRWRDIQRDNRNASSGLLTLRYSWADITLRPCQVAQQIADVLRARGAALTPRRCGQRCALQRRAS